MSDEQVSGSAHGEHRSDKPELRLRHVGQDARQRLRLLLRAKLQLLREIVLLRTELLLRAVVLLRTEQLL
jgi:hypothetical protein